jgi:Zn-dependent M16 (insulinase) family peptidase
MENYKKVESKYIDDIKSTVTIYQHIKTGAKICTIENSDDNKVFAISFRTPPMDSTGLTHILEHSVLCGSKKYPAKDPFVSLLKGSLNTFLNALTFSDKTVYPLASCNLKDFKNLMGVYMDAVLYPNIYKHKEIFMQEGWHYDINTKDEPLKFNGVVFNEMKGDFSNPDSLLFHAILKSLHPTTAYQYESGGDPKEIPSLSYESFLEFHHKYYNPTNSFIYIYGNCDMEERLKWMDKEYLSKFDKIEFNTEIQSEIPFKSMKSEEIFYPVGPGEDLKDKTSIALSFGLQDNKDIKLSIAIKIINDLILESPGAFLKKAILDSKIAKSVDSAIEDEIKQPFYSIILKNSNKESIDQFVKIFSETLTKAIKDGLDHEAILADINFLEFKTREGQFGRGIPQGLTYIFASLGTWLYDEKKPYSALENLACFAQLREDLSKGYFEEVIKHYLLDSTYKSLVLCSPSNTLQDENEKAEIERLASIKAKLSDTEIDSLIKANAELKIYQSEPSTKEAIAALPHLGLSDINPEPKVYPSEKRSQRLPYLFPKS